MLFHIYYDFLLLYFQDIVNSLSSQGHLPLGLALIEQNTAIANTLINGNADVNAVNSEGSTLLIDAIKRSDGFSANFLLDHNCDVNLTTQDTGDMALHIICTYSRESTSNETFKEMLEVGKKVISKKNLEINKQNLKGYSPLHLAIVSGYVEMINELLKNPDIDLNLLTYDGKCALLLALLSHHFMDFSVAKCLIDNGADTNFINDNGDNILQFLIKSQREDVAIFMCDHINLDYKNHDNLTSLHLACKYGLVKLSKKILTCGASPNIQTGIEEKKTALHFAIEANNIELVEAFVEFKLDNENSKNTPDFNLRCANGDSPLSLALNLKHNDLVPILIKGGSDVNARNGELTLLHQAILKESAETAIFLLEQGADSNALTGEQESPLELAIHCRLESVVDALCNRSVSLASPNILWSALETEQENIASVLVKHGIDTDCWSMGPDGMQQTLLHRAIEEHNEYAAIFLIRSGCDLDSPRQSLGDASPANNTKESPLHMCCTYGLTKVVQTLIEHGANVNALNHENKTPLHHAIQNQHESIIAILLRHPNIDMKIRDKQGNTAFATALTVRNHKAAEKILDRWPTCAEQIDSRGRNFLHLAIMREDLESVLFLLAIQVDVNSRVHDVNQATPLMLASQSENEMLIRNLILAGARLNDRDSNSQKTALHIAAERGRLCAVQALLQNGCDYDAIDAEGNNALHIAMRECMLPIVRELLTESRINAEVLNMKGRNPLHELCRCGRDSLAASICELFLECMPNYPINQPDLLGNSPLLLAYMRGETQLCRVLVKSGACLGAENKDGVSIFNYKLATNQLLYRLLDELSVESPWSSSDFCQECATKFSLTMRKHHCRHCGRMICSQCSNNDVPIIKFGINKPVRVCRICFEVLQTGVTH
ncbi:hypothetical protein PVAND_003993 [Polypedilum vanderplanki]|uniref:FYVE-type domain-containing protein n=1 Tax=Polypedilum vanderplanki TaxID=319348 RepID=A0A9J6BWD6_POLVA|nr:hypothetical protein PVAND_003993 [Polypedilum vanderplanki]